MQIPSEISGVVTQDQWNRLRIGRLTPHQREVVVDIMLDAFRGEDPEEVDPDDVEETVELVEDLVDDFLEESPKMDEDDLIAGEQASDAVLEEMAEG